MKKIIMIGTLVLVSAALISISGCAKQEQETVREGYKTYSKYGFSFEYPRGFLLFEQGLLESEANDTSGVVAAGDENEEVKYIYVSWMKMQESLVDLEGSIEGGLQGMEVEGVASVERGELVETTKAGHEMLYRYYAVTIESVKAYGIVGVWYCDKNQKLYLMFTMNNTISSKQDVLADYRDYLDHFVCH